MTNDLSTLESAIREARTPGTPLHAALSAFLVDTQVSPYERLRQRLSAILPTGRDYQISTLVDSVFVLVRGGDYGVYQWRAPLPVEAPCKARWGAYECAIVGPHDAHATKGGFTQWGDAVRTDRIIDVPDDSHTCNNPEGPDDDGLDELIALACDAGRLQAEAAHAASLVNTALDRVAARRKAKLAADAAQTAERVLNATRARANKGTPEVADGGGPLEMTAFGGRYVEVHIDGVDQLIVAAGIRLLPNEALEFARLLTVAVQRLRAARKAGG